VAEPYPEQRPRAIGRPGLIFPNRIQRRQRRRLFGASNRHSRPLAKRARSGSWCLRNL